MVSLAREFRVVLDLGARSRCAITPRCRRALDRQLDALVAIPDLLFDDHGQSVLDDGTLSSAAYATDVAAATAASQAGVTVTLIATSDEIASWWDEGGGDRGQTASAHVV